MLFQTEVAFEGNEDGLDPVPDVAEFPESELFVLAVGADQVGAKTVGDEILDVTSSEALVAADDLALMNGPVVGLEQCLSGFAFADLRVGQGPQVTGISAGVLNR